MKVLIVEDNIRLTERLKAMLGKLYLVTIALNGEDGLQLALSDEYSVIVLDLGLPDVPGAKICKSLRDNGINAAVLILTATDDTLSRVQLLNYGADDYLSKPFNGAEFVARIAALSRRQTKPLIPSSMIVHDLEINTARREVRRNGQIIQLRRKEFDILEYLVTNSGRAVSREMILSHAWQDGAESWNNTVDVHIKHLRDKIDRPYNRKLIKTAYGIGYMVDDVVQSEKRD